jgi:hypothetical protein
MKRYWLFSFPNCYPSGGFEDFNGSFDTIIECDKAQEKTNNEMGHIFDSETKTILKEYYPRVSDYDLKQNPHLNEIFDLDRLK